MEYPKTNKALRFSSIGGPLEVIEKEVPSLPAHELLVKVHAASINPCDIQLWRSGLVGVVAGDKGMVCIFQSIDRPGSILPNV